MKKSVQVYKLSPSALNLFQECERCFWLEKHKVWKRPEGIFPSLPSGMDRILKIHFDKFRDNGKIPPELCEKNECNGMKLFDKKELLKVWQNNFKGISWTDKNGNELHGAIDNILIKGSGKNMKLIVLDYKTRGYAVKEDTAEHYRLQLNLYNFLLRKNSYLTEDYAFLLFYVPREVLATGEVMFDTELVRMGVEVEQASKIFNKAIQMLSEDCPKESCEWCERV